MKLFKIRIAVNTYKIKRDHDNDIGFFIVTVPEDNQRGIGFQFIKGEFVYGISITNH